MNVLVAVAHYDDEVIGASALLAQRRWPVRVLHVTDSAPLDLRYARRARFPAREEYAVARRREMLDAVRLAGLPARRCRVLDIPDQEAPRRVPQVAEAIGRVIARGRWRVFTHAYEGGHPDHDACAMAARLAVDGVGDAELFEMPYYHAARGVMVAAEFIDAAGAIDRRLGRLAVARRRAMFDCFASQAHVFARFPPDREPYRLAPKYDFGMPPHPGKLYYETRPLGWTWREWRQATRDALPR